MARLPRVTTNNMYKDILLTALRNATLTLGYVVGVVLFLMHGAPAVFEEPTDGNKAIMIPIFMLLTLIVSASVTGYLVLGKPILWYWDGRKEDAMRLFITTLLTLFCFMLIAMSIGVVTR